MGLFSCCAKPENSDTAMAAETDHVQASSRKEDGLGRDVALPLEPKARPKSVPKEEAIAPEPRRQSRQERDTGRKELMQKRDESSEEKFEKIRKWTEHAKYEDLCNLGVDPTSIKNLEDPIFDDKSGLPSPPTELDRYAHMQSVR